MCFHQNPPTHLLGTCEANFSPNLILSRPLPDLSSPQQTPPSISTIFSPMPTRIFQPLDVPVFLKGDSSETDESTITSTSSLPDLTDLSDEEPSADEGPILFLDQHDIAHDPTFIEYIRMPTRPTNIMQNRVTVSLYVTNAQGFSRNNEQP